MATKTTKTASTTKAPTISTKSVTTSTEKPEVNTQSTESQSTSLDATAQLLQMMQQMQSQLSTLSTELANTKAELASTKEELNEKSNVQSIENNFAELKAEPMEIFTPVANSLEQTSSSVDRYIEILANRKSDKEVTIVHNREVIGGGTTHLSLSNMTIDFKHLGETRTISLMQFEELTSNYRGFFEREIILVADKDREIAEEYTVPCMKRKDGAVLTRADLNRLPTMSVEALTTLYNSLTPNDKKFMLNYWLGQCYNREKGFYERYKIEALNALSQNGVFDTLIAFMNGESLNAGRTTQAQQQNNIVGKA